MEAPPPSHTGRPSRPPARPSVRPSGPPPALSLEAKIEDPERTIDTMLGWLARGGLAPDAWDALHAAARRDGCADAVAAAFTSVANGPRIATLPPSVAAELHLQAARYCEEVMADDLGAAMHLERCLELSPGRVEAFAKMEVILGTKARPDKLSELYAAAALHRPRGQQALMLRRAAELHPVPEKALAMWQEVVRLEPGDDEARSRLETLYVEAGRFLDAARLDEQTLARDPAKDPYGKGLLLERIIDLYADRLDQPERAIVAVEQLLALDRAHSGARRVAERLLTIRGLTGRAAAALAAACAKDAPQDVDRYLTIELETARGSRRAELLVEIGTLREERLGDLGAAIDAYDQALELEPALEDVRARYVALTMRLGFTADTVRVLERVIANAKDSAVEVKASAELGEALLARGEAKRAKAVLSGVVESLSAPADAVLRAARALATIHEAAYDRRALCDVLDRVALLAVDADERRDANQRIAAAALKMRDPGRAIEAYERLLSSSARAEALDALDKLYRGASQREKLARLLAAQAAETEDPARVRALLTRAAEVRAREVNDVPGAIAILRAMIERFGPDRELVTLLEQVESRS